MKDKNKVFVSEFKKGFTDFKAEFLLTVKKDLKFYKDLFTLNTKGIKSYFKE